MTTTAEPVAVDVSPLTVADVAAIVTATRDHMQAVDLPAALYGEYGCGHRAGTVDAYEWVLGLLARIPADTVEPVR